MAYLGTAAPIQSRARYIAACVLLLISATAAAANTYDAAAEFDSINNPSSLGPWSYGRQTTPGGAVTLMSSGSGGTTNPDGLDYWSDGATGAVQHNPGTNGDPITPIGIYFYSGELTLHPGSSGEIAILRWTAPSAATIDISALFTGRDTLGGTTTDVHVLKNGTSLFNSVISGFFTGPPGAAGASSTAQKSFRACRLSVAAGDTIDFAVGYGPNLNYGFDNTGVRAIITTAATGSDTYDAACDFSPASNPNDTWSYGGSSSLGGAMTLGTYGQSNLDYWCVTAGCVQHNPGPTNPLVVDGIYAYAEELMLHPGANAGEYAIVRWTAPSAGTIEIDTHFTGRDTTGGTFTDVHVLKNGTSLFDGVISGAFSGPPGAPGAGTAQQVYNVTGLSIAAGDTIDFAVGYGTNGTNFNDNTGVRAIITAGVSDTDGDGIPDDSDICPGGDDHMNSDADSVPNFCDPCPNDGQNDADGDGVCGDLDFCPGYDDTANEDGDSLPDACDVCPDDSENDADGDGICAPQDNCPMENPDQVDTDGDHEGDVCDLDVDGDGEPNASDNCPFDANAGQADAEGDGAGDACDSDDDNDAVLDAVDACVPTPAGEKVNADGCSISQLSPCEHAAGGGSWKNHGAYVSSVSRKAGEFLAAGLITQAQKDAIMSAAAQSSCGSKAP